MDIIFKVLGLRLLAFGLEWYSNIHIPHNPFPLIAIHRAELKGTENKIIGESESVS